MPAVRPAQYRDGRAWIPTYMPGPLNVSNMTCVVRSRLARGFIGASVSRMLFFSGQTRSSV